MKKQKLSTLKQDIVNQNPWNPWYKQITFDVVTLNDYKRSIEHFANFHSCISSQLNKEDQWYHGVKYRYRDTQMMSLMNAIVKLNDYMGYELEFNANGFAYIKSK